MNPKKHYHFTPIIPITTAILLSASCLTACGTGMEAAYPSGIAGAVPGAETITDEDVDSLISSVISAAADAYRNGTGNSGENGNGTGSSGESLSENAPSFTGPDISGNSATGSAGADQALSDNNVTGEDDEIPVSVQEPEIEREPLEKYRDLLEINPYIAGWLKIDGTVIDEPVVYTPGSQNYFLHRAIDGSEKSSGTLFIAINWQEGYNNTLIYGHNMKNGTSFGSLSKFSDEAYGKKHNIIHFDTLYEEREYELYAAFYSQIAEDEIETEEDREEYDEAIEEGNIDLAEDFGDVDIFRPEKDNDNGRFRYYYYTDLADKDDFFYYASNVKKRALYDTGIEAEWGDEFVTMSTCSYHVKNGRFVVVGIRKH